MKKIFLLLLAAALCLCVIPVSAKTLTPALACLADDVTVIKTGILGKSVSFAQSDFKQALGVSSFESITVTSLPSVEEGSLTFSGSAVKAGQSISASSVHLLKFTPASDSVEEGSFTFTAGDLAGGAEIGCRIRFVSRTNYAPTVLTAAAETLAVETQKGISYFGSMSAADPEGDELYYRVISYPENGILTVTDAQDGSYQYTPASSYTGSDSFRYVVRDEYGNWSGIATVSISVTPLVTSYVYADMENHPAANAALVLSARNMMQGTLAGDSFLFSPDGEVTRGDFVVMAMKAAGASPIPNLTETCFDDNASIPSALRPYIATAQRYGIVYGSFENGMLCFDADRPITRAEAAVILCRLLDVEEPDSSPTFADKDSIPVWARASVSALYELGIYTAEDGHTEATATLTRADAAQMLYRTLKLSE